MTPLRFCLSSRGWTWWWVPGCPCWSGVPARRAWWSPCRPSQWPTPPRRTRSTAPRSSSSWPKNWVWARTGEARLCWQEVTWLTDGWLMFFTGLWSSSTPCSLTRWGRKEPSWASCEELQVLKFRLCFWNVFINKDQREEHWIDSFYLFERGNIQDSESGAEDLSLPSDLHSSEEAWSSDPSGPPETQGAEIKDEFQTEGWSVEDGLLLRSKGCWFDSS